VKRLIEFPLEDGTSMAVEVDEPGTEGMVRAARPGEITEKATQTFEAALERLKPAAAAIISQLRGVSDPPEQIGVEFGVKLSAGAGAVIASAGAEANYKVTLTWRREETATR
jgi:hypothetical protein